MSYEVIRNTPHFIEIKTLTKKHNVVRFLIDKENFFEDYPVGTFVGFDSNDRLYHELIPIYENVKRATVIRDEGDTYLCELVYEDDTIKNKFIDKSEFGMKVFENDSLERRSDGLLYCDYLKTDIDKERISKKMNALFKKKRQEDNDE